MDRGIATVTEAADRRDCRSSERVAAAGLMSHERLARAGALWCVLFALAHFYWAAGGRLGVSDTTVAITDRPMFLAYDLAAGLGLLGAAVAAVVLSSGRLDARLRSRLLTATVWGALLALVRGAGGLAQDVITAAMGHGVGPGVGYDIWFAVAGVVFLVAGRGLTGNGPRRRRPGPFRW